ncbi:MAG: hypothetical protein M0Z99_20280 [Betaproteobacteria bacterium]|nr:hypothetical protein [Betaproteobacteria bacterium]
MADKLLVTAIEGAHMLSMGRPTFWRAGAARMLCRSNQSARHCVSARRWHVTMWRAFDSRSRYGHSRPLAPGALLKKIAQ